MFREFAPLQVLLLGNKGELMAVGHLAPIPWDGTVDALPETIESILQSALALYRRGEQPDALSALAAMVDPRFRGRGLASEVVQAMREIALQAGCRALLAPLRPTWKDRYPLAPMERYVHWVRPDGAPLDPWIRLHWRSLKVAPATLTVKGSVADWERWAGMAFPESGQYVVPGALQPVEIDRESDRGFYRAPNFWVVHPLGE